MTRGGNGSPLRLLQEARIAPDGMLALLARLAEPRDDDAPAVMDYSSTHPRSVARVEALRAQADQVAYEPVPVLEAGEWGALRRVCADRMEP